MVKHKLFFGIACFNFLNSLTVGVDLEALKAQYLASIPDAAESLPSEVMPLTVIAPWNKNLIFNHDKSRVLVTSWVPQWAVDKFYRPALDSETKEFITPTIKGVYVWVTAVPEVQKFAYTYLGSAASEALPLHYRLQQLLGLPPVLESSDQRFFVQMWVDPKKLFRPCIDREVLDQTCIPDIEFKTGPYQDLFGFAGLEGDSVYQNWFNDRKKMSYDLHGTPYPWTRLGYTYDWGSIKRPPVGVTEFAVDQGVAVEIEGIYDTQAYAARSLQLVDSKKNWVTALHLLHY